MHGQVGCNWSWCVICKCFFVW